MAKKSTYHGKYRGVLVNTTDFRKLDERVAAAKEEAAEFIIFRFQQIGEECVRIARDSGDYHDISGNLRSSIDYVILRDGVPVVKGESKQYKGSSGNGEAGIPAAEALLAKLQAEFPWGIVLIVCAGMNYAAYVENIHHKDVLTSAELKAESLLKKLLNGIVK